MSTMHLHSKGREELIKKLNTQKRDKIIEVIESDIPKRKKGMIIKNILSKFDSLIKETDQSLFLEKSTLKY